MYAWIDLSNGAGPPSKETKRKIRSHVTKSLALQRRKDERKPPPEVHPVALDGESAWRRHKYKKRAAVRKPSTKTILETNNTPRDAEYNCELYEKHSRRNTNDSDGQNNGPFCLDERQTQCRNVDNGISQSDSNEIALRTPPPEGLLTLWSDNIPMHGDVMLRICAFQMNRFRPDVSIERASDVTGSVWSKSPCVILSYALCLAALGHLHSTTSGSGNNVVGMFKGKVFREMINRLPTMNKVVNDEMVPSILCMVSFELSRVSLEARTHLEALNTIRKVEQQKGRTEFPIMFEALDILHSLMFDFPTVSQVEMSRFPDEDEVTNIFAYLQEEQGNFTGPNKTKRILLWDIEELLVTLRALMSDVVVGSFPEDLSAELYYDNLEDFRSTYCTGSEHSVQDQCLARCCYHIFAIMYNILVNRRPFRHPTNKKHATGVYFPIQANLRRTWDELPRLKLWILVVALSATRDSGEQSLFQDEIATTIYQFGTASWDGIKSCLCSFLRIRNQLDARSNLPTTRRKNVKKKPEAIRSVQFTPYPHTQFTTPSPSTTTSSTTSSTSNTLSDPVSTGPDTTTAPAPAPAPPLPHPRFIPFPHHSLTASILETSPQEIYPELGRRYPFTPAKPLSIDGEAEEDERILYKGYEFLVQDHRFGDMVMKGEEGRISFIGTSLPGGMWVALF